MLQGRSTYTTRYIITLRGPIYNFAKNKCILTTKSIDYFLTPADLILAEFQTATSVQTIIIHTEQSRKMFLHPQDKMQIWLRKTFYSPQGHFVISFPPPAQLNLS